jgi:hypothetical protein
MKDEPFFVCERTPTNTPPQHQKHAQPSAIQFFTSYTKKLLCLEDAFCTSHFINTQVRLVYSCFSGVMVGVLVTRPMACGFKSGSGNGF